MKVIFSVEDEHFPEELWDIADHEFPEQIEEPVLEGLTVMLLLVRLELFPGAV